MASERYEEALAAFQTSLKLHARPATAFLGLGKVYKSLGYRDAAIAAFVQAWHLGARSKAAFQLKRYGARDSIPEFSGDTFPVSKYEDYLRRHAMPSPPVCRESTTLNFLVRIDARDYPYELIIRTIQSLRNQTCTNWGANVVVDANSHQQLAALFANDSRFYISQTDCGSERDKKRDWILSLRPGLLLHPEALSWFAWTAYRYPSDVIYADHDHYQIHESGEMSRCDPVLHPMADPIWFGDFANMPSLVAQRTPSLGIPAILGSTIAAHIPLLLASAPKSWASLSAPTKPEYQHTAIISIIIPSRDNADLLAKCIRSLIATAAHPERLDIIIVDNGVTQSGIEAAQTPPSQLSNISVIPFPFPFNWSTANNLGVRSAKGDQLLFLNDDTVMLTHGWDDILDAVIARPEVGVVGARLHYPAGGIQHAGFIFGLNIGPQHEGRWMPVDACGPSARWSRMRQAPAVTGAFMAMKRETFHAVGGFDDVHYRIDFSDLDMCLAVRETGRAVVYLPQIAMIHEESVSRGYNRSREKRRRAAAEWTQLRSRWGTEVLCDPGYNPRWSREDACFDGYRALSLAQITNHIGASVAREPWRVQRTTNMTE